jgi:hypothetical protein
MILRAMKRPSPDVNCVIVDDQEFFHCPPAGLGASALETRFLNFFENYLINGHVRDWLQPWEQLFFGRREI